MKAYFLDIDTLMMVDNKVWIIDKTKPNVPIIKISKEDFNLYESGIYKSQGNKVEFNGKTFWLPTDFYNHLKVRLKNSKTEPSNLALSLQEFMNKELIENLEHDFNFELIDIIKNKVDDIWIVCSRQTKTNYQKLIDELEYKLLEKGIKIKGFYFISETFYNQTEDQILFKKARLYLQHLTGYRTDNDKFSKEEIQRYDKIIVWDKSASILTLEKHINPLLKNLIYKTDHSLANVIKENIDDFKPKVQINYLTDNQLNRVQKVEVTLGYSNLIKSFENYCLFFR